MTHRRPGTADRVLEALGAEIEKRGGIARPWADLTPMSTDEADRGRVAAEVICLGAFVPVKKAHTHVVMQRLPEGDYQAGRIVAILSDEESAVSHAEKLQMETQGFRYGVFALVGEAMPIKAVSFHKTH